MNEKDQIFLNYLANHNTMVLSTYGEDGPWSTPVFFVNRGYRLYFLSEPTSKHSCNLHKNPLVAATITEDYKDWSEIQGIQLKGQAYIVSGLSETAIILALFLKKFPAVRHILQTPDSFKGVSKTQWHCIEAKYLKFTDNTNKFGERFELEL
ncbi:MAG: pyridoxamine 5'-phosphate oxidase family protein [Clostridia bacterium]|nr:pyridoxamine 5'-phosphate oxidase family protein [Clostridia bacterium]